MLFICKHSSAAQSLRGTAMNRAPARILYLPNEKGAFRQRGMRQALAQLQESGLIERARILSPLWRKLQSSTADMVSDLRSLIQDFRPNIVLVQHPEHSGLTSRTWQDLRSLARFVLVYQEGDAYDVVRKRMHPEMLATARAADIVFTVGASRQLALFRRAGASDVRWCPNVYSPHDFGIRPLTSDKQFQVVMIANHSPSRIPLFSMPGSRERQKLQHVMAESLGDRFALFGSGWSGAHARGPVPYLEQESVIGSADITVNWDHYPRERLFFSDRLPIALASGTVHVTTRHPGYEDFFGDGLPFLHFASSPDDVLNTVTDLLDSLGPGDLAERAHKSRAYADQYLRQDDQLVALLNAAGAGINPGEARRIWADKVAPLLEM